MAGTFFIVSIFIYRRAHVGIKRIVAFLLISLCAIPVAAKDTITIVMFGDSLTHGYGLPESDGLVPQLQAWINDRSNLDVTLINASVSGDTTAGGLARIDWALDDTVDAVIVELGGNDLLRGIFPEETRSNLDGILRAISTKGLPAMLIGLPAPANYGPEFKAEFDAIFPTLARKHNVLLYPFYMEGLGVATDTVSMLPYLQADRVHPNAEGVRKIVAHLGPRILVLIHDL